MSGICEAMNMVQDFHKKLDIDFKGRVTSTPELFSTVEELSKRAKFFMERFKLLTKAGNPNPFGLLRAHLLCEELSELFDGMREGNEQLVLDALADLLYVLLGAAVTFDLPLEEAFLEVHASNMTKERQQKDADGVRVRQKGPNYRAPDLARVLREYRERQILPNTAHGITTHGITTHGITTHGITTHGITTEELMSEEIMGDTTIECRPIECVAYANSIITCAKKIELEQLLPRDVEG